MARNIIFSRDLASCVAGFPFINPCLILVRSLNVIVNMFTKSTARVYDVVRDKTIDDIASIIIRARAHTVLSVGVIHGRLWWWE